METRVKISSNLLSKKAIIGIFNNSSADHKIKIENSLSTRNPSTKGVVMCDVPNCEDLIYVRHGNDIMFTTYAKNEFKETLSSRAHKFIAKLF